VENKFPKSKGLKKKTLKVFYKRIIKKRTKNGIKRPSVKNKKIIFFSKKSVKKKRKTKSN
jgi:hypothetical protein